MALGLFNENMLGQYLMAGIKRSGGSKGFMNNEGDARMQDGQGGPGGPQQTDQPGLPASDKKPGEGKGGPGGPPQADQAQGSPGAGAAPWMAQGGRAVRATDTGGFDAGYAQNLATFAGQNLARPGGTLQLNPFSKTEGGFFPGGEPQTMNASALEQGGYPDLSAPMNEPTPKANPFQRFSGNAWMRGSLQRAGLIRG